MEVEVRKPDYVRTMEAMRASMMSGLGGDGEVAAQFRDSIMERVADLEAFASELPLSENNPTVTCYEIVACELRSVLFSVIGEPPLRPEDYK